MDIAGIEYLRIFGGIFMLTVSGSIWTLLLFNNQRPVERIVLGFGFSSAVMTISTIALSLVASVTSNIIWLLFTIFTFLPIFMLAARHRISWKEVDFAWPDRMLMARAAIMIGILVVVFYMTLLPHIVQDYSLPFHADSWVHWAHTRTFMETGKSMFPDPFTGLGDAGFAERGFHVWAGCISWLSGAKLQSIFVIMPSVVGVFTALAAYALGRRSSYTFGIGGAFFTAFIPTTLRFLGPSFMVPLSLGLFLTLLSLLLVQWKGWRPYTLLALILVFLTLVHPPSAALAGIPLLSSSLFFALEKRYRRVAAIIAIVLIPALIVLLMMPLYFHKGVNALLGETYTSKLVMVNLVEYLGHLGYIMLGLFFVGLFAAFYHGKPLQRSMALSTVGFFAVIILYGQFAFGPPILYDRSFAFFFLFVALMAGYGLESVYTAGYKGFRFLSERYSSIDRKKKLGGGIAVLVIVVLCLGNIAAVYPHHVDESNTYYRVINQGQFRDFTWLHDHIDNYRNEYNAFSRAAVEPRYASVFSAVTGIHTLSSSFWPIYGKALRDEMQTFLASQAQDTGFMEKHDIGVVYGRCQNEHCQQERDEVYLYYGVPPEANFTIRPHHPQTGQTVTVVSTSTTRFGRIINHTWTFGDNHVTDGEINGISFDGDDDFVEVPSSSSLDIVDRVTIGAWVYSKEDGRRGIPLSRGRDDHNGWYWWVDSGEWRVSINRPDMSEVVHSGYQVPLNEWHHLVVTIDNVNLSMDFYVDGAHVASRGIPFGFAGNVSESFFMGRYRSRGYEWEGWLDDVRIYGDVLSGEEVEQWCQGNLSTNTLVSQWSMDKPGETVEDSIWNNTGRLYGAYKLHVAEHSYETAGAFEIQLTIRNEEGLTDTAVRTIYVVSS